MIFCIQGYVLTCNESSLPGHWVHDINAICEWHYYFNTTFIIYIFWNEVWRGVVKSYVILMLPIRPILLGSNKSIYSDETVEFYLQQGPESTFSWHNCTTVCIYNLAIFCEINLNNIFFLYEKMDNTEYVTMGNNVVSREPQYQCRSPRQCRERKRGNSCRSVHFLNESKKDKRLKNNFEQNNQVLIHNDIWLSNYLRYLSLCFHVM